MIVFNVTLFLQDVVPSTNKKTKRPPTKKRKTQKRARPKVEIEYEIEEEPRQKERAWSIFN